MLAQLDKLIELQVETTTKNDVGTPTESYSFAKQTWAQMYTRTGFTEFAEEGSLPQTSVEWTIRYNNVLNYKCRIFYNCEYYKILHIQEIGRKEGFKITTIVYDGAE